MDTDERIDLYTVTYTKLITLEELMDKRRINLLLNDPNVKSINIKK